MTLLGGLKTLASQFATPAVAVARGVLGAGGGRRAWTADGRAHIEVRGVHEPGTESAAEQITDRLTQLPGVRWAEVNAALGRVVVGHDPEMVGLAELVNAVDEAERASGLSDHPRNERSALRPGDVARAFGDTVVMGANLTGLGYAVAARWLPVPALAASIPALISTADSVQGIRAAVQSRLGAPATDLLFGLGSAATNTLAQRPTTLLSDAAHRFFLVRESQAVLRSWARREAELGDRPEHHRCEPVEVGSRPTPLPNGPIERVANTSAVAGPAAFLGALAVTRSMLRAQGFLVAGVPRAAGLGRDAFAAQLGIAMSERDALVLDPRVLRSLDRIDTVVIDAAAVQTGTHRVRDVIPLNGEVDIARLWERAHAMVGVVAHAERDGWALSKVRDADLPRFERKDKLGQGTDRGVQTCTLERDGHPVAIVEVEEELEPLTAELFSAASEVGSVVLAGADTRLAQQLNVDRIAPAGTDLAALVRELQADGRGVAVVSTRNRAGLAAADLGIGVAGHGPPPWGAHLITRPGLGEACALLGLIPTARTVSRRSAQLAVIGSASGALLAAFGPAVGSQARAAVPVSVCGLLALGAGTYWGMQAGRRPVPSVTPRTPWHAMSASTVLELLDSSPDGLTDGDAQQRALQRNGHSQPKGTTLTIACLDELASPLTPALAGGAGISASIGAAADAVIISGVLGLNALIGGVQRVSADRALRKLLDATAIPVALRRKDKRTRVPADELVPGDVIDLVAGDAVPADCRLLEADGLEADESSLTGESQLVPKTTAATPAAAVADRHCMLYQGTAIAAGRAVAIVVATAEATEAGSAGGTDNAPDRPGGVAARLRTLTKVTVPISIGAGGLLLVADLLRRQPIGAALGRAVSLAVAAVPEGLPFVATVAELAAARRLSKRGALVHNSSTIEALGRADVLCFDKTGTLTEGRIALRGVSDGATTRDIANLSTVDRKILAAALRASPLADNGEFLPHPTDRAVVNGARDLGVQSSEGTPGWQLVEELPFEPSRGYHMVLGRVGSDHLLSIKGAPEVVLAQCTHWRRDDVDVAFDEAARLGVEKEFDRLARQGYRVLAVAERPATGRRDLDDSRLRNLRMTGLIALADPVRPTAAAAVDQLQQAGVQIIMITGDHPSTAEAIAAELGILGGHQVMTGTDLDTLDDDELAAKAADIAVFARTTPAHKARIVQALQRTDRVVAVTGDGANDAPAIRIADIGIALGERATPAAREAADVVVTDDRIETIVDAIVEGRAMWASVRDSLALLLGGNLGEVLYTVATGLLTPGGSMNARQMLLVNLLTDVIPAMAIAVRPPPEITPEMLLEEGPDASLGAALHRDIYRRGIITAAAAFTAWFLGRATGTRRHADTVALVALVGAQLGQTLVIRGRTPLVVAGALASMAALAAFVQTPGLSHFFGSTPLLPHGWAIALGCTVAASAAGLILQPRPRSQQNMPSQRGKKTEHVTDHTNAAQETATRDRNDHQSRSLHLTRIQAQTTPNPTTATPEML
ncbi:HAD-IC family P-type ATPase [Saccharopolyspora sp. ASAGF58]|uniref:HAD-IC family P-type ATPase n=1 Tax=Saccharopolyspora sp. ASAGF58 TaxID=2719023 RepID=UPI0014400AAF|nr:HAD-IC family P-type ATPase [Saccharopolyspora sp. ASAGF58]QIZ37423.1 HAD family hydrolase [Saccharopolyspora sp. ASAGF58]